MSADELGLVLCLAGIGFLLTWFTGRGGYLGGKGSLAVTWTPGAIGLAVLSIGLAVAYYGVTGGIAIVGSVMWHEWGHVIAYRVAGHTDARFRLIPLFGGVAISNQSPKNHAAECFVVLMGPGFSVSLLILLVLAEVWLRDAGSPLAPHVYRAAVLTGALNAFNMLPLWPLDGGRALRSITITVAPGLSSALTMIMSACLAALALMKQAWLLLMFAVMGFSYAQNAHIRDAGLRPMTGGQAALAAVGYLTIFGVHALAGMPLFRWLLRF